MAARKNGGLRGAFTLFEILAVIAIIAMVSIFTVLNFSFLDNLESRPLPAVLKNAARSARLKADLSGRETALFFDADA
ncbi:MAG: prepilin-type N-terminal cleavage/methylation domain-containing protein, partial [Opitutales bacterium]|nr:prepilin-type N-terminal cleavage/methylation domain-containing protein [Opitutales bacterium]